MSIEAPDAASARRANSEKPFKDPGFSEERMQRLITITNRVREGGIYTEDALRQVSDLIEEVRQDIASSPDVKIGDFPVEVSPFLGMLLEFFYTVSKKSWVALDGKQQ